MSSVATERHPAALKHLIKSGKAVRGVASVMRALDGDVAAVTDATSGASTTLCIAVSDLADGVAAVKAASERGMRSLALLSSELCADDPYAVQLAAAELGDAGADAIVLSVSAGGCDEDELRELVDLLGEIDLLGVPMRQRLGLRVAPKPTAQRALDLVRHAHHELELLHFVACLAGKDAPHPSELLKAIGVKAADADMGALFLAEHVPDAA